MGVLPLRASSGRLARGASWQDAADGSCPGVLGCAAARDRRGAHASHAPERRDIGRAGAFSIGIGASSGTDTPPFAGWSEL